MEKLNGDGDIVNVGGIAGDILSKKPQLIRCENYGEIEVNGGNVGGISGRSVDGGTIKQCANYASVKASHTTGGIAGQIDYIATITSCVNYGNVLSTGTDSTRDFDTGGIVGYVGTNNREQNIVEHCYTGNIALRGMDSIGGIAGANNGVVRNCYSLASSTSNSGAVGVSGVIGIAQASSVTTNCYSQEGKNANAIATSLGTATNVSNKSYTDMLNNSFVSLLNNGSSNWKKGATTPILEWQEDGTNANELVDCIYMFYTALSPTNKVMDVTNAATADSSNVALYDMNYSNAQKFEITKLDSGYYKIKNVNSGKYLDVYSAGTDNGTNLDIYTWNGSDAQLWEFIDNNNGYYAIQSKLGHYIHVADGKTDNNTNLHMWNTKLDTNKNWQWMLKKAFN